jgi:hypothetical protein
MINILSLFDGISAAKVALQNLGIKIDNYYLNIEDHIILWARIINIL